MEYESTARRERNLRVSRSKIFKERRIRTIDRTSAASYGEHRQIAQAAEGGLQTPSELDRQQRSSTLLRRNSTPIEQCKSIGNRPRRSTQLAECKPLRFTASTRNDAQSHHEPISDRSSNRRRTRAMDTAYRST